MSRPRHRRPLVVCVAVIAAIVAAGQSAPAQAPRITFAPATPTVLGTDSPAGVAVADLNHDGHHDLAVSGRPAPPVQTTVGLFRGDGRGFFANAGGFVFQTATAIAAADFDGNGVQDLVVTQDLISKTGIYGDQVCGSVVGVAIFLGPAFSSARCIATVPRAIAVQTGDFDGDGRPDFALVSASTSGLRIYSQLDFVTYGVVTSSVANSNVAAASMASPSDLNGDGILDLIVGHSAGVTVFLGNGNANFTRGATLTSNRAQAVAVGMFDADTRPDLAWIESGTNGRLLVGLGAGDGTFSTQTIATLGTNLSDVAIADLDKDGRSDIIVAHKTGGAIRIYWGDGTGTFTANAPLGVSPAPAFLTVRDYNEDGRLDLGIVDASAGGANSVLWVALQLGENPTDTTPPTVALTAPAAGTIVTGAIAVAATAADNVGVTRVEFFANSVPIGMSAGPDYRVTWDATTAPVGSTALTARAFDAAGNESDWASVEVTVAPHPNVVLSPAAVTFAKQRVGITGAAERIVHLQNTGPGALLFSSFSGQPPAATFSAGANDFQITTNCPLAGLAAGGACDFAVRFSPSEAGSRQATLAIADNAPGSPHTVALSGEGFNVDEPTVVQALGGGGTRVRNLQTPDGGWYFQAGTADCAGGSCPNIIGVTALGLISTYLRTGDADALAAARKSGDLLKTLHAAAAASVPPTLPFLQDVEFLKALGDATADPTYVATAISWFQILVNQYPTGGGRVDALMTERERQARRSLVAWDAASLIRAAKAVGFGEYAVSAALRIRALEPLWKDTDPAHRFDRCAGSCGTALNMFPFDDTLIGEGSLLWAIHDVAGFETSVAEYSAFLRAQQDSTGSWDVGDSQVTAYAVLGLAAVGGAANDAPLLAAGAFFIENQLPNGGWPAYVGLSGPGPEYTEFDAEVTRAMMSLFNTGSGTNVSVAPAQVSTVTFSTVVSAGMTTATAIDPAAIGTAADGLDIVDDLAYDVQTTASFAGDITVCFSLFWIADRPTFDAVRLVHREGGALVDRTILSGPLAADFATRRACALVTSLSPFVVARAGHPPVAVAGRYTTKKNHALSGTLAASDADGDRLTFEVVTQPSSGTVVVDRATGAFTYTPKHGADGLDQFTFRASDGLLASTPAAITVTIVRGEKEREPQP